MGIAFSLGIWYFHFPNAALQISLRLVALNWFCVGFAPMGTSTGYVLASPLGQQAVLGLRALSKKTGGDDDPAAELNAPGVLLETQLI